MHRPDRPRPAPGRCPARPPGAHARAGHRRRRLHEHPPRAKETADIIGGAFGGTRPTSECDWCEIHAGSAEGLTYQEMFDKFPLDGDPDDTFDRRIPGGETWAECYARVGRRLGRIAREHAGGRVVVVGHGGTVGASFVALGNLGVRAGTALTHEARNTSITEWRWVPSGWRLVRYNDAAHLEGV